MSYCSTNRAQFVEKRLMLSLNFRCDQIYRYNKYDFGHNLMHFLCQTQMLQMFNKPASTLLANIRLGWRRLHKHTIGGFVEHQSRTQQRVIETHRHLRNIDCLMAHTACLVCFISTVNSRSKKRKKRCLLRAALVAGT